MILDNGYSATGIVSRMIQADGAGSEFNSSVYCHEWSTDFSDEVKEYIKDFMATYTDNRDKKIADKGIARLYTLMLYDSGEA